MPIVKISTLLIEEPSKGKKVSQADFNAIMNKKSAEMVEQFCAKIPRDKNRTMIRVSG